MNDTTDELQEALRPLASRISKSEKAQQKVAEERLKMELDKD